MRVLLRAFVGSKFYNIGVNVETDKNINDVVNILHDIENTLGRDRNLPKFSSRIIDLILFCMMTLLTIN